MEKGLGTSAPFLALKRKPQLRPVTGGHEKATRRSKSINNLAKQVTVSKESLYEENLSLKQTLNQTKTDLVKYKTQVFSLKKKREPQGNSVSFANSLAAQLGTLKEEKEKLQAQLIQQKSCSRSCKIQELETEVCVFRTECGRLRKLLEEALIQLSGGLVPIRIKEKYLELSAQVKLLKRENKELSLVTGSEDSLYSNKRLTLLPSMKANLLALREENEALKTKNTRLSNYIELYKRKVRDLETLETVSIKQVASEILTAGSVRRKNLKTLWYLLSRDTELMSPPQFHDALARELGINLNKLQRKALLLQLNATKDIDRVRFIEGLKALAPNNVLFEQAQESLEHLQIRYQIQRMTLKDLTQDIMNLNKTMEIRDLMTFLMKDPVKLQESHAVLLCDFLYGMSSKLDPEELVSRFRLCCVPWCVLSLEQESELDSILTEFFRSNGEKFYKAAVDMDIKQERVLPLEEFSDILTELDLEITEELSNYLKILSYTEQGKLDEVPYLNILKAYASE